ncbi:MAG: endonuclease III [Bacteroidota bacterium]|nr:endonuclease III [Bacteroidota bacterium]
MRKQERYDKFLNYFAENKPVAETELVYNSAYELLVAVILSAQCTDKRVNIITPAFFKYFPDAEKLAKAEVGEIFELIKSCSFPNNKAKHLLGMAVTLTEEFNNIMPSEVSDLEKLPGVGRKTANVIASVIFNKPTMAVDTHVFRVAERIGLTVNAKNPLQTEKQLIKYIPPETIPIAHHWLILHGRYICKARRPLCDECPLTEFCKYFNNRSSTK